MFGDQDLGFFCQFSWHLDICSGDSLPFCDGWPKT
jgi:hypothetical protein